MKDRLIYGLIPGLIAPFIIILLFWIFRFHYLSLEEFIRQAIFLKVQFKIVAVGEKNADSYDFKLNFQKYGLTDKFFQRQVMETKNPE